LDWQRGDVKTINARYPLNWYKDSLLIAVTGIDNDERGRLGPSKKQKYLDTGDKSANDYASDWTKFDLRGYLDDEIGDATGQKYTRKFTIGVDGGNIVDLHFDVHGTVTAWYKYPVIKFRK